MPVADVPLSLLLLLVAQGPASMPTSQPAAAAPKVLGVTDVTVAVTYVGPQGAGAGAGAPVTLQALPATGDTPIQEWFGVSDQQGAAVLSGVSIIEGARYVATALADGVPYDSRPVPLRPAAAVTIPVTTYAKSGDASAIRVARVFTRVGLWEGQLEVHQAWTFVNPGPTTYDPSLTTGDADKGLLIRLPEGAEGAKVDDLPADKHTVVGTKILYTGWLRPGVEGSLEIRVSFGVGYDTGVYAFEQPSAYPLDEVMTIVPEVPAVRHRQIEGVRLSVGAHNHGSLESASERGTPVWVLSGVPAGPQIRFEVAGLPHYDTRPAWGAVIASVAIVAWGLARILLGGSAPVGAPAGGPGPAAPVPAAAAANLRKRRELLMDKLVGLERDRSEGGLSDDDFRRRREVIKRRLIDVDRRLEGAS